MCIFPYKQAYNFQNHYKPLYIVELAHPPWVDLTRMYCTHLQEYEDEGQELAHASRLATQELHIIQVRIPRPPCWIA